MSKDSRKAKSFTSGQQGTRSYNPFQSVPGQSACRPILEPDTKLDRFHIRKLLGQGGLGDVYLAHDTVSDETVAVKVVNLGPNVSLEASQVLKSEWAIQAIVQDHRHVLKVHDLHQVRHGGTELLVLSMEYAAGGSFRDWLQAHREDLETRRTLGLNYFKQICLGIAAANEAGVPHLDPKPENFLLVQNVWKISDFSVSVCLDTLEHDPPPHSNKPQYLFGTPAYMSPEHFTAGCREDLDARADIYSLGIVLYEILDGRPPFDGTLEQLKEKHLTARPRPLDGSAGKWWPIAKRCLEKEPSNRYRSVSQLVRDLDRAAQGVDLTTDVSCPGCGHINDNEIRQHCEHCGKDISSLFKRKFLNH